MKKELQQSTQKLLSDLKQKNQQLLVKWNAGGDETIVNIYTKEGSKEKYFNERGYELNDHIADLLELPNAGEYYNNGNGEIYIESELIFFKYNELAYYEDDEVEEERIKLDIKMPNIEPCKKYIKGKRLAKINYYGSISYLDKLERNFTMNVHNTERKHTHLFKKELHEIIEKNILNLYKNKRRLVDICYGGYIAIDTIYIDQITIYKYTLDKNNKGKIRPLF